MPAPVKPSSCLGELAFGPVRSHHHHGASSHTPSPRLGLYSPRASGTPSLGVQHSPVINDTPGCTHPRWYTQGKGKRPRRAPRPSPATRSWNVGLPTLAFSGRCCLVSDLELGARAPSRCARLAEGVFRVSHTEMTDVSHIAHSAVDPWLHLPRIEIQIEEQALSLDLDREEALLAGEVGHVLLPDSARYVSPERAKKLVHLLKAVNDRGWLTCKVVFERITPSRLLAVPPAPAVGLGFGGATSPDG